MSRPILEALDGAEHEQVQILQHQEMGLFAAVAIHSTVHGPAFGGVRRFTYRNGGEAIRDVLRLSRAMTCKCVMARVPGGGGKAVLVDHPDLDVPAAYRLLGRYIENMGGRFYTGPDVGTGPEELGYLAESTTFVTRPGPDGPGDLSLATARGVLAGIRAVVRFLGDTDATTPRLADGYEGLRFLVQGCGVVGSKIVAGLAEQGAAVLVTDVDPAPLESIRARFPIEVVDNEEAWDVPCDVFVPCALGGILHDLTVERLQCRAIAGSANNILASPEHGAALAARGILVAPDYLINSGALILGANFHLTGCRDHGAKIDSIEEELYELFCRARRQEVVPCDLADRIVEERLAGTSQDPYFPAP